MSHPVPPFVPPFYDAPASWYEPAPNYDSLALIYDTFTFSPPGNEARLASGVTTHNTATAFSTATSYETSLSATLEDNTSAPAGSWEGATAQPCDHDSSICGKKGKAFVRGRPRMDLTNETAIDVSISCYSHRSTRPRCGGGGGRFLNTGHFHLLAIPFAAFHPFRRILMLFQRRRTQIRLAQRAYRNRRENTIQSLQKQVEKLEKTNTKMRNALKSLRDLSDKLVQTSPELGRQIEAIAENSLSPSDDEGEAGL
ncbi:uncharacterized protein MKZ38_008793 [Zalerion maritima]|uniref:BZIP domain-containing protein n=1 Tax=Zalerion maritima TaxID=339359 RepID=A0AAD5RH23_9PEZI|nr:uncharacterized protein MKZ38_008793 [Zalerion maritima]